MARGRMLDQAFLRSRKLQSVRRDARLVYASILTKLDRKGRICAEPNVLMVDVFRKTDFTIDEVTTAVAELHAAGLILLYSDPENAAVLEFVKFAEFNKPNKRETASEFSEPDDAPPVRDEALIEALVKAHGQRTDNARAPHVQRTDNADASHEPSSCQRNGTEGSVPEPKGARTTAEPKTQAAPPNGAPRPKGRGPSPEVAEYLTQRAPREKSPIELEAEAAQVRRAAIA